MRQMYLLLAEWEQEQRRQDIRFRNILACLIGEKADILFPLLAETEVESEDEPDDDARNFQQVAGAFLPQTSSLLS